MTRAKQIKMLGAGGTAPSNVGHSCENDAEKMSHESSTKSTNVIRVIGPRGTFGLSGNRAVILSQLLECGERGVSFNSLGHWAFRLAADIYVLKRRHGLTISTVKKWNGRSGRATYVLQSELQISSSPER